jgi:ParB/RepB/Spo0J family partition protein
MSTHNDDPPTPPTAEMAWWATELVWPTPDNPRRQIDTAAAPFLELVASVKVHGILQPLIARPHPSEPGVLDLRAGNRRLMAAQAAGLRMVPVMVREMDDRTAMEITVLENMNREDLTPMEEARGVDALIRTGHDLDEIAERLGKTRGWVARRAGLLALTEQWKEWAEERKVGAAHLELIARLPVAVQDLLFHELEDDAYSIAEYFFAPKSLAALRERTQGEMRRLKLATWDLEDAMLVPVAGSCTACPKRTGCHPDLFVDAEEQMIGDDDRCLDAGCWVLKARASKATRMDDLVAKHGKVLRLSSRGGNGGKGVLDWWGFDEVEEGAEGALLGVYETGEKEGMLAWVKPTRNGEDMIANEEAEEKKQLGKRAEKAQQAATASMDPEASAALLAEKLAGLEARRWKWVGEKLGAALTEAEEPVAEEYRSAEGLCRLVAGFGAAAAGTGWVDASRAYGKDVAADIWLRVGYAIGLQLKGRMQSGKDESANLQQDCVNVAHLLGMNLDLLKVEADEAIPEPATWQQLRKLTEAPAPASDEDPDAAEDGIPPKKMRGRKPKAAVVAAAPEKPVKAAKKRVPGA